MPPFPYYSCPLPRRCRAAALDLKTAVAQALQNSPSIRIAEEKLNQLSQSKFGAFSRAASQD